MSDKYLIFGATGSIGSSLAEQLKEFNQEAHLFQETWKSLNQSLKNLDIVTP